MKCFPSFNQIRFSGNVESNASGPQEDIMIIIVRSSSQPNFRHRFNLTWVLLEVQNSE